MNNPFEAGQQIEHAMGRPLGRERLARPAAGSVALHAALGCTMVFYGLINGLFHHNTWGGAPGGGAIQVQVTSAIPLPAERPNDNVLSTETPSPAPALPEVKPQQQLMDTTAIPIPGPKSKPKPQPMPKTNPHQQPVPDNRAHYGEQSGMQMPRSMAQSTATGPTAISDSQFGLRFPWYVDGITRKLASTLNPQEVDASTAHGAHAGLIFTIRRDGSPTEVQLMQSSGSSTLDRACVRAVQRVDTFGQLPTAYNGSTVKVTYDCVYQGAH